MKGYGLAQVFRWFTELKVTLKWGCSGRGGPSFHVPWKNQPSFPCSLQFSRGKRCSLLHAMILSCYSLEIFDNSPCSLQFQGLLPCSLTPLEKSLKCKSHRNFNNLLQLNKSIKLHVAWVGEGTDHCCSSVTLSITNLLKEKVSFVAAKCHHYGAWKVRIQLGAPEAKTELRKKSIISILKIPPPN